MIASRAYLSLYCSSSNSRASAVTHAERHGTLLAENIVSRRHNVCSLRAAWLHLKACRTCAQTDSELDALPWCVFPPNSKHRVQVTPAKRGKEQRQNRVQTHKLERPPLWHAPVSTEHKAAAPQARIWHGYANLQVWRHSSGHRFHRRIYGANRYWIIWIRESPSLCKPLSIKHTLVEVYPLRINPSSWSLD